MNLYSNGLFTGQTYLSACLFEIPQTNRILKMKCVLIVSNIFFASAYWNIFRGSYSIGVGGTYGTKAVPAAGNTPGSSFGAATAFDETRNLFYFFGGNVQSRGSRILV